MDWSTIANFSAAGATFVTAGVALWIAKIQIRAASQQLQEQLAGDRRSRRNEARRDLLAEYASNAFELSMGAQRLGEALDLQDLWQVKAAPCGDMARAIKMSLGRLELLRTQIAAHGLTDLEPIDGHPSNEDTHSWLKLVLRGEIDSERRRHLATWLVNVASISAANEEIALSGLEGPIDV